MNKSRRMAAVQARAFADAGWAVLQIDLFGCGDSAGDFADATWQRWVDDVVEATKWLQTTTGHTPVLWGLRFGCLLLTQAARDMGHPFDFVLWQPVTSGKQLVQQFLRLKLTGQILSQSRGERSGTQQLREQLARGEAIEIAGYSLSPELVRDIEAAELQLPCGQARVAWLELAGAPDAQLAPASRVRVQSLQHAGHRVEARVIEGAAFWQTQEVTECPQLVEASVSILSEWQG